MAQNENRMEKNDGSKKIEENRKGKKDAAIFTKTIQT